MEDGEWSDSSFESDEEINTGGHLQFIEGIELDLFGGEIRTLRGFNWL